ncbi:MAG: HAD-IIA family hydrolase [Eubacteriales bacterium]|nr:HAD-IIA family hydrolase [Eubacteriales bacterium]
MDMKIPYFGKPQSALCSKKLFLLDMDGTLYIGDTLLRGAAAFLAHLRLSGCRYIFLTNNSSKSVGKYVDKLSSLGIRSSPDDFVTSVDASVTYVRQNLPRAKIYAFGTASFRRQLSEAGLDITDRPEDDVTCLLMGYDTELTFQKLEDACFLLGRNVDYIAANPDLVCPVSFGFVPDCGSISEMLFNATGRRPVFIGKPKPDMINMAMEKSGHTACETLLIGDRLYTDIAGGSTAGVDTALVLSGESNESDVLKSKVKPNFIFHGVWELLEILGA